MRHDAAAGGGPAVDKDFFRLPTEHFTIEGRSRAGHETYFRIRELGVALDIGRCPDLLVPMQHVFITHAHLDHAAGLAFYGAQRRLQQLGRGTVYVPAETGGDVDELLRVQERLTGAELAIDVRPVAAGEELRISRKLLVRAHASFHRVAARAYEFFEVRHHLRSTFEGLEGREIGDLRRQGVQIDEEYLRPVLYYTGDTDRGILESSSAIFEAEVLIIECSFVADGHQGRAAKYRHIHIDDIAEFAHRFENQMIVLSHFSRRYSADEIRMEVRRRLPQAIHERIRLALPERWQRLHA